MPMYSPSLSQSVQMNNARAPRASLDMLLATSFVRDLKSGQDPFHFRLLAYRESEGRREEEGTGGSTDSHGLNGPSFKQSYRITILPFSKSLVKVPLYRVPDDRGHGHIAFAPWGRKPVVKVVVLDVLVCRIPRLEHRQRFEGRVRREWQGIALQTFPVAPPERCWVTAFAIEGFSATHKILPYIGGVRRR